MERARPSRRRAPPSVSDVQLSLLLRGVHGTTLAYATAQVLTLDEWATLSNPDLQDDACAGSPGCNSSFLVRLIFPL